jgi:hypothetical protein
MSEPAADFLERYTALILAAEEGHLLVVEKLIAAGAGLDVTHKHGYEPFARLQRLCAVRAGSQFVGRWTALISATAKGHTLVVEQLIAAGAGLDVKTNNGYGPIYPTATAVRCPSRQPTRGQVHCAHGGHRNGSHGRGESAHCRRRRPRRQGEQRVRANMPDCNCAISEPAADSCRGTALMLAAWKGHALVVEQLIAAGAGLNVNTNFGYEPIYLTATAVRCPSRQPRFVGRFTALMWAAAMGHTDITAALIFAGADVDVSNNVGYGKHRRGRMVAVARALERTSPGQGDCEGRLRS